MSLQTVAHNRYFDPYQKRWAVKLLPGEYALCPPGEMLVTTLGSCIAACIWDTRQAVGGMNHFMLPSSTQGAWAGVSASARYGNFAMEKLVNEVLKKGGSRQHMRAHIFGGGQMFGCSKLLTVGQNNIAFARTYLQTEGIPLDKADVGGTSPRKVYFFAETGKTMVRYFAGTNADGLVEREQHMAQQLDAVNVTGEVELF